LAKKGGLQTKQDNLHIRLAFWEVITIIHAFIGTVLIESITSQTILSGGITLAIALMLFLENLFLLGYARLYMTSKTADHLLYLAFAITMLTIILLISIKITI